MLQVGRGDVGYGPAERLEFLVDGGCQCDGGEDGEGAGGELYCWTVRRYCLRERCSNESWRGSESIPIVALPPNLINPKRRKGTESVVTPGTTSRMTITSSGLLGMSF